MQARGLQPKVVSTGAMPPPSHQGAGALLRRWAVKGVDNRGKTARPRAVAVGHFRRRNESQLPLCGHSEPVRALVSLRASTHGGSSGILGSGGPQWILPPWPQTHTANFTPESVQALRWDTGRKYSSGQVRGSRGPPGLVRCAYMGSGKRCTATTRSRQRCFMRINSFNPHDHPVYAIITPVLQKRHTVSNLPKVTRIVSGRAWTEPRLSGSGSA